jgi:2-dehydropantoate 2-reductase
LWKIDDRKGPLRQIQKGIKTEVDFTLAYVVRQGEKLQIATPLCQKLLTMIHELEHGTRKLSLQNYDELRSVSAD